MFKPVSSQNLASHQQAYLNRGFVYDVKGQYEQAIADYSKAIEINPEYAEAYVNRGVTYSKGGQYELRITDFNKAIEMGQQSATVYSSRGNAYQQRAI